MCKALQIYYCDPKELIQLYRRLQKAGLHIPEALIEDAIREAEILFADPHDVMFNPRDC